MNKFPRQIIIDFVGQVSSIELTEQAIDEALEIYQDYNFELWSEGISYGVGMYNFAYFDVKDSKPLDVNELIYRK